ncbi:Major facilitator superfamily domain-containing protein 12 [Stylophora pistillata]|uniref:Major facilitator superfamily domain-containing protein 12 n=1 Tax=Stylophora pistillata TaxID=50429 RepID=A0A2B4RAS6_STYPI|nr:Major facilitator superfamily domain-containing protein 12 [Stylophora pistillata]
MQDIYRCQTVDGKVTSSPVRLPDFVSLSWIATGTGVLFAFIFLFGAKEPQKLNEKGKKSTCVGSIEDQVAASEKDGKYDETDCKNPPTKEPQRRLRVNSTYSSIMNAPGIILTPFGSKNAESLAHRFVDMIMASSQFETYQHDLNESEDILSREQRERKKSFLRKSVNALLKDKENDSDHNQSNPDTEMARNNPESEDTKNWICLEVENLDRERKNSLLFRVYNGLFSRLHHAEERQATYTGSNGHQAAEDNEYDKDITGGKYCKKEEMDTIPEEKIRKTSLGMDSSNKGERKIGNDKETMIKDFSEASVSSDHGQSEYGHPAIPNGDDYRLPSFGFTCDRNEDAVKANVLNTSVGKPNKAVTFSSPVFPAMPSMLEDQPKELVFNELIGETTNLNESAQNYLRQSWKNDESIVSYKGNNNSSVVEANPDLHGPHVLPESVQSKRKRPKRIKDWLRDPNLYKVAIIFTCTRLAQDAVYSYLPLFLTERLLFVKEAIAYIPLILLISSSLSSLICNRLSSKIGSKETSGSVFATITVIARISSGGLIICIQKLYPEESSNRAVGEYVRLVFAMTPGTLTLVGFLLVLLFQPSKSSIKSKGSQNLEDQADQSSFDIQVPRENEVTQNVCLDKNQTSSITAVHSFSEDTKL